MTRLIPLAVLIFVGIAANELAAQDKDTLSKRWNLLLLPEKVPTLGDALTGTSWFHAGLRTRIGDGSDFILRFPAPANKGVAELEVGQIDYRRLKETKTFSKVPLRITGSFLEYNGQVRTVVYVKDESKLVIDAGVRVGKKSWYFLQSDGILAKDKKRVVEYLFEFEDDPLTKNKGRMLAQEASHSAAQEERMLHKYPATFYTEKRINDGAFHRIQIVADSLPSGSRNFPTLFLAPGGAYGMLSLSELNGSGHHVPEKKAAR